MVRSFRRLPVFNVEAGFEQQDMGLLLGDGPMLDTTGDNQELAFLEPDLPVPELHPESPFHHEEELVLVIVMVPDELALKLDQFELLAVQLADDLGAPRVVELGELLREVHFFCNVVAHRFSPQWAVPNPRVHSFRLARAAAAASLATNSACSGEARPRSSVAKTVAMSSSRSASGSSHRPGKTLERWSPSRSRRIFTNFLPRRMNQ